MFEKIKKKNTEIIFFFARELTRFDLSLRSWDQQTIESSSNLIVA